MLHRYFITWERTTINKQIITGVFRCDSLNIILALEELDIYDPEALVINISREKIEK